MNVDDDQIGKFMDDALARRGQAPDPTPKHYEAQLRVIGRFIDEKKPREVFFFEVDGAYIARLTVAGKFELVEFTSQDIADLVAGAPTLRRSDDKTKPGQAKPGQAPPA